MKSTIGVYIDQQSALDAIEALKKAGFPATQISLLGHAPEQAPAEGDIVSDGTSDPDLYERQMKIATRGVGIGAVVGPILGILAGIGLLSIPGLGTLVGAGAIAGGLAGLDAGLIGGGVISALAIAAGGKENEGKYQGHLEEGRYLIIAQGTPDEVKHAHDVLTEHDNHMALDVHHV